MSLDIASIKVVVTGASGFVAGHIIAMLLEKGYHVRGTVKDINDTSSYSYLNLLSNSNNLEIVQLNLLDPYDSTNTTSLLSWNQVFTNDITFVIHVASPYILKPKDPQGELIDVAVNGTKTICEICESKKNIKKLIVTSCINALADSFANGKEYSEIDWNNISTPLKNPYSFSKTQAELTAYRYFQASSSTSDFQLVTLLPGVILGPHVISTITNKPKESLPKKLSTSHKFLLSYLNGSNRGIPNLHINITDVRDVAHCHILALESDKIHGRYIICNKAISHVEMLQVVHDNFIDLKVPSRRIPDGVARIAGHLDKTGKGEYLVTHVGTVPHINTTKSIEASMYLRPPAQTISDTCRFFIDYGLIEPAEASACTLM